MCTISFFKTTWWSLVEGLFLALCYRNFSSCSWIIRPPILLQLGSNCYSKVSVRKCADKLRSTRLTTQYPFDPECDCQERDLRRPDVEFVVQLLVHTIPEYRLLQAYFNLETPSSLIFELLTPVTYNGQYFTYNRRYLRCTHQRSC